MKSKTYANGDEKSRDPSPHIVTRNHCSSLSRGPFNVRNLPSCENRIGFAIWRHVSDIDLFFCDLVCDEMKKMGVAFHV